MNNDFYKLILDSTYDWEYLIDIPNKKIIYMSPSVFRHTGYTAQDFINDADLLNKIVLKEDLQIWQNHTSEHSKDDVNSVEYRIRTKDGKIKWISHECIYLTDDNLVLFYKRVSNRDVTKLKNAQEKLRENNLKYQKALMQNLHELVWMADIDGKLLTCNKALEEFTDKEQSSLIGKILCESEVFCEHYQELQKLGALCLQNKNSHSITIKFTKNMIKYIWLEITMSPVYDNDGAWIGILNIAKDVTEVAIAELILQSRTRLQYFASNHSLEELLIKTLDEAELLSGSEIGFYHFVENDQESLSLQAWSSKTSKYFCKVEGKNTHYRISDAGVWVDCIRQKKAIIHNDYASLEHKRGMPDGHAVVIRQMLIPVFRQDKIVAILGVGNKKTDYIEQDLELALKLADFAWDIALQKRREEELLLLAHYDALTALPNRSLLIERLKITTANCKRNSEMAAVCMLDLDGFKPINDTYGHEAGDIVLKETAKRLLGAIRENDTAARLGGDEFVIIIGGLKSSKEAETALDRLILSLSNPIACNNDLVVVNASIGVTFYPLDSSDDEALIRHADQAMYDAKQSGKNQYRFFNDTFTQKNTANKSSIDKFKNALKTDQLRLYYQPKVNCRRGKIVGMEALVRWNHPILGLLSPDQFLPLIEKDVAIIELGEFVIKQAVIQMNEWLKIGINMPISVNIAAKQLKNANFKNVLIAILQENGYDNKTSHLEIEIIESAALEDAMLIESLIKTTKELGVSYALDDFGTGHSSLTHLKNLQVDTLKIDKSFIANILEDTASLAIVESVTALARAFNKNVIAEGVENIEQTLLLLDIDCDIMQGYAIARPMPIKDATHWIENFSVDPRWSLTDASRPTKQDFNIMLAEANIRYWTENALLYAGNIFENRTNIDDFEINFQENGFKRWLYNDGVKTYSQFEEFQNIERLFISLDLYATKIIESAKMKNLEQLGQNSLEFKSISAKLVETLRALRAASIDLKKLTRERYERI